MNVSEAIRIIMDFSRGRHDSGLKPSFATCHDCNDAIDYLHSLNALTWQHHKGGKPPQRVWDNAAVVLVAYEDGIVHAYWSNQNIDWSQPLVYVVISKPPAPPKPKRWRAQNGQRYWYLQGTGKPSIDTERGTAADDERWEIGNYFPTEAKVMNARPAFVATFKQLEGNEE